MIADKTYCLTKDGRVVGEKDPESFTLLAIKGGYIDDATAKKHGLLDPDGKPADPTTAEKQDDESKVDDEKPAKKRTH